MQNPQHTDISHANEAGLHEVECIGYFLDCCYCNMDIGNIKWEETQHHSNTRRVKIQPVISQRVYSGTCKLLVAFQRKRRKKGALKKIKSQLDVPKLPLTLTLLTEVS